MCDILLCTIRETSHEFPFVFEIISPNRRNYVLQAESEEDKSDWVRVIRSTTERLLEDQGRRDSTGELDSHPGLQALLSCNPICAECGSPSNHLKKNTIN